MEMTKYIRAIIFLCSFASWTLVSCGTVAQELLSPLAEYDVNKSVNMGKPGNKVNTKQQDKERERLIQAGKCPTCSGMGKTPDGSYTCMDCNGTGKYQGQK